LLNGLDIGCMAVIMGGTGGWAGILYNAFVGGYTWLLGGFPWC
jgi:hypothetical protein